MSCAVGASLKLPQVAAGTEHVCEVEPREADCAGPAGADGDGATSAEGAATRGFSLQDEMLDHLALSSCAHFKSQQIGDPELTGAQKREIAHSLLQRSSGQFLARFGYFLEEKHLEYFKNGGIYASDYEVQYHVQQLQRFHSKHKDQVDVKNRRYEALKKLVDKGSYFSESEMRKRNPLLYERLVGRYLTKREVEDYCNQERDSINSLVNLFLVQIERAQEKRLRQSQLDAEDGAVEEMDTSDEDSDMSSSEEDQDRESDKDCESGDDEMPPKKKRGLTSREKQLLKQEFVTSMYQSFLDGKDVDFDYSEVDRNPEYDCLKVRGQDEEEKYFDCETPEEVAGEEEGIQADAEGEDEDELDRFMRELQPEPTPASLAAHLSTTSLNRTQ
ncbi:coiled-coil domain-containing protein 97 [Bacillus rossius redtenbacheri]|uniref:coiled-coil domain-containing protein 97 n=1 Tax=Bacillus rossius redtenbacheri TaxID=93214 RepID=UPI002FDD0D4A